MADNQASYRFTIRDLLIATTALAVLLLIWIRAGAELPGWLVVTLVTGGLFLRMLSKRPIQECKAPFTICTLLTVSMLVFFFISIETYAYRRPYQCVWVAYERAIVNSPYLVCLLASAALIVCYLRLIKCSIRPVLSQLLLAIHLIYAISLVRHLLEDRDTDALYGCSFGIALLTLPAISHWLNSLPATREEIQETPTAEESTPPDK